MNYHKEVFAELEKCYSLAQVTIDGRLRLLAAAEKHDPCYMFDGDGCHLETLWEKPGGVMTMVPIPGMEGAILATQRFYSSNDSKDAKLVCAIHKKEGWEVTDVAQLPFVHRFDIIQRNGVNYVLVCTLKSGHEHKDDWSCPGKLWVGILGDDPAQPLALSVLKEGLTHNHGYTRWEEAGIVSGIVSCDEGVFQVTPPAEPEGEWVIEQILSESCSDAVKLDMDGDGKPELFTISPFHGDTITIWHMDENGTYQPVYQHPEKLPFLHAITAGIIYGRPCVFVGNREGKQMLLTYSYDAAKGYVYEVIEQGRGPANVMLFEHYGWVALMAANRESNEVAIYDMLP